MLPLRAPTRPRRAARRRCQPRRGARYFTAEDARRDYGVVVTEGDPPGVDARGTEELRRRGRL